MKACKILAVIFAVVAVIGLARFAGGMGGVNAGVFLFPGLMAALFAFLYRRGRKKSP